MIFKVISGLILFSFVLTKTILWIRIANKTSTIPEANEIYQRTMPEVFSFIGGNPRTDTFVAFLIAALAGILLWSAGKKAFKVLAVLSFILSFWMLFTLM